MHMNGKAIRYSTAGLAALCFLIMLAAPILEVSVLFMSVRMTFLGYCKAALQQGELVAILFSLVSLCGVAAALAAALIPAASNRTCGWCAVIGGFGGAVMLLLLIVGVSSDTGDAEADMLDAISEALMENAFTPWLYLLLLLLAGLGVLGILLMRSGAEAKPRVNGSNSKNEQEGAGGTGLAGRSGAYANTWITLSPKETLRIGRDPAVCNLVLEHQNADISRSHCAIRLNSLGNAYLITDYSRNGTYWTHEPSGVAHAALPKNVETSVPRGALLELGKKGTSFLLS